MPRDDGSIVEWFSRYAPPGTVAAGAPIGHGSAFCEAEAQVVASVVDSRRREFLTGRRLAREALAAAGAPAVCLPRGAAGVPSWPQGFLGSISHSRDHCIVLVGRSEEFLGLGVDLEPRVSLDEGVSGYVLREDDVVRPASSATAPVADGVDRALVCFVAKEAFYKAWFPRHRRYLDFQDVRVDVDLTRGVFSARIVSAAEPAEAGAVFRGRLGHRQGHVIALLSIEAPGRQRRLGD